MSQQFHRNNRRSAAVFAAYAAITIFDGSSRACGPFFPNQILVEGDTRLLAMPIGDFTAEMRLLKPPDAPAFKPIQATPGYDQPSVFAWSAKIDREELRSALARQGADDATAKKILGQYAAARQQITDQGETIATNRADAAWKAPRDVPKIDAAVPDGLPGEFADYLRGLIAFRSGDMAAARAAWTALLARPAGDRHFRGVWAAFMLGRSYQTENPAEARKWFVETRQLATGGFADSLGLAESSLGWEAKTRLSDGSFSEAMHLYMEQMSAGDATASMSLRDSARSAFAAGAGALKVLASDETGQRVVTAFILSDAGPFSELSVKEKALVPVWLTAVESADAKNVAGADRLAWAAYRSGDFDAAGRWAARAPADAVVGQWVRSKLLLRDGKVEAAARVLATVVKSFPSDNDWVALGAYDVPNDPGRDAYVVRSNDQGPNVIVPLAGDLAILQLSRAQYADALDLLVRGDFNIDAAYIAERVLTVDELEAYVDRHFPPGSNRGVSMSRQEDTPRWIRHLLARRLTRLGKWKEARPYYPDDVQPALDQYIAAIRAGHDKKQSNADRAKSFMTAARIAHDKGMDLLGTELLPDNFCYSGNFFDHHPKDGKHDIAKPSDDERARVAASAPDDARRYHFYFVAADHAWDAALLMPDDKDETAAALCEAGGWIKYADPKAADRFYKALVTRCPSTALGKQAAAKHWFPASADKN